MPFNTDLLNLALWEIELDEGHWDQTCCTPTDDDEDEPREED